MKTLSVRMIFWHCSRLNSEVGKGARDFLAILRESGGEILRFWPPPKQVWEDDPYSDGRLLRFVSDENETLQAHPEPEKEIDRQGNFNATFSNRFLTRSAFENKTFKDVPPTGNLDYFQNGRFLWLSQLCRLDRPQNVNDVAHGQLGLGKMLYPRLCPTYGWIDEAGDNLPSEKNTKKTEIKYIFWANFFGPDYVKKFGRDFLLGARGWKKEELADGGILYVLTENFLDWWKKKPAAVLQYFRSEIPGVKLYKAKESYD